MPITCGGAWGGQRADTRARRVFGYRPHDPELPALLGDVLGGPSEVLDPVFGRPYTKLQTWIAIGNPVLAAVVWAGSLLAARDLTLPQPALSEDAGSNEPKS